MQLIAAFPMLAVYAYHAYCHYEKNESMYIHRPEKDLSIAENFPAPIKTRYKNSQNWKQEYWI